MIFKDFWCSLTFLPSLFQPVSLFTSLTFAQAPKGFEVDKSGAIYKVEKANIDGKPITEGTIVHGHYSVTFGDSLIFTNFDKPAAAMFGAMSQNRAFQGDLIDGLFLMKEGETFIVSALTPEAWPHLTKGAKSTLSAQLKKIIEANPDKYEIAEKNRRGLGFV